MEQNTICPDRELQITAGYHEIKEPSGSPIPEAANEPTAPTRRIDFDHLQFGKDYEIK